MKLASGHRPPQEQLNLMDLLRALETPPPVRRTVVRRRTGDPLMEMLTVVDPVNALPVRRLLMRQGHAAERMALDILECPNALTVPVTSLPRLVDIIMRTGE
jgi:hypothetical protein